MGRPLEVKSSGNGWAVKPQGSARVSSRHRTKAEAIDAGRRSALDAGGGEIRIHSRDGRLLEVDRVGAPTGSDLRAGKRTAASLPASHAAEPRAPRERAFPTQGPRTTLRVPEHLADSADRLAEELGTSRNDALVRLPARGAEAYERETRVAPISMTRSSRLKHKRARRRRHCVERCSSPKAVSDCALGHERGLAPPARGTRP
ncbi:MAG: DUF2188 domain-containing protein [Thermoleophilaceae bacterium]|nr:DUF2188 domain-containing protein [Thermoleophilaceae bacterium]